jgi:hypothetical protein
MAASAAPSATAPGTRTASSVGRTSGMISQGGGPASASAGPALSSLVERVRDRLQILGGEETERSLSAHRRARVARQEGPHLGPFDAAVARGYSDIR